MSGKRKSLTLKAKVDIINAVKKGHRKKGDIANEYGLAASSLSTILKNQEKILASFEQGEKPALSKRMRPAKYEDVENALFTWFKDVRAKNIPVGGQVLHEKAKDFAFLLGHENFRVSVGWVEKFKHRHGILCRKACGELESVAESTVQDWLDDKMPLIADYDSCDVFNMDETGLFYRALPEYTLTLKGQKCHGGKKSKDRLSIALCCNMDGSERIKLLVIGKSKNPRCLKGVRSLPVMYRNNRKAWMTRQLFEEWLLTLDKKMQSENRKILLLLDNVSSHVTSVRLQAITLLFFPPNTTSKMQPLDQGIIRSVKANYRRRLVKRIILNIAGDRETKIDIRMSIDMLYGAWNEVHSDVMKNCFKKTGIRKDQMAENEDSNSSVSKDSDTVDPSDTVDSDSELWAELGLEPEYNFESFVDIDEDLLSSSQLTDSDIVREVKESSAAAAESDSDSDHDDSPPVSVLAAIDSLQNIRRYFQESEHQPPDFLSVIDKMETCILNENLKKKVQRKITDYARA